ncbi:hypothetical protein BU15DRAFT_62865 [Melanogaster broomeanus]|nr:hypothetical protein BU15DRAFT_62865 [Melanogaster broomeanus]
MYSRISTTPKTSHCTCGYTLDGYACGFLPVHPRQNPYPLAWVATPDGCSYRDVDAERKYDGTRTGVIFTAAILRTCPPKSPSDSDLTLGGTQLYIAPEAEVSSRRKSPRNHNKAHMYSLRTVSFDMVYAFSIGADRIAVIEDLRKPEVYFPRDWKAHRSQQKQTKPDSPYYQSVLSALFSRPASQFRSLLYDLEEAPEHAQLHIIVEERISAIFRLHGAVDMEPPLLAPSTNPEENQSQPTSIYRHGVIIPLPNNVLLPFARLVARRESVFKSPSHAVALILCTAEAT